MTPPVGRADTYEGLRGIIALLRAPDGCPWDREQTHASLRSDLLEECYEALEALDQGDPDAISEELGDLLVQVAFHCQIAEESGEFTDADVFRRVSDKLVRRHPHVFGDVKVQSVREVEENWEAIKEQERAGTKSLLEGVSRATPALAYAQAISHRAARAGFEWEDVAGVAAKVSEEIAELGAAQTEGEREHELGDVLLALVNLARWLGLDAESALRRASERFYGRFTHMERAAAARGEAFTALPMAVKETLWAAAKDAERGDGAG